MGLKVKGGRRDNGPVVGACGCGCSEAGRRAIVQVATIKGIVRAWILDEVASGPAVMLINDVISEPPAPSDGASGGGK